jgi:hypothetical protein
MTVPTFYTNEGRRYSRGYSTPYYSDQRYPSSLDPAASSRKSIMTSERDIESESNRPRKRIAVAVGPHYIPVFTFRAAEWGALGKSLPEWCIVHGGSGGD